MKGHRGSPVWWQRWDVMAGLSHEFSRHVVILLLNLKVNGKPVESPYTGILLEYRGLTFWITAGHCAKEIDDIQNARLDGVELVAAKLLDTQKDRFAVQHIPIDLHRFKFIALDRDGVDLGFTCLPELELRLLKANVDNRVISTLAWKLEDARPEAYCLVGTPAEGLQIRNERRTATTITRDVSAPLFCLPLKKIRRRPREQPPEFWASRWAPSCFYGKLLPFIGSDQGSIDIRGVSGGPVLSLQHDQGRTRYFLFAIQSKWLPDRRIICATPVRLLLQMIDVVIETVQEQLAKSPR